MSSVRGLFQDYLTTLKYCYLTIALSVTVSSVDRTSTFSTLSSCQPLSLTRPAAASCAESWIFFPDEIIDPPLKNSDDFFLPVFAIPKLEPTN